VDFDKGNKTKLGIKKWGWKGWTGLVFIGIGVTGSLLKHGNEPASSINAGNILLN
jgi:hypothetical protein